MEKAKSAPSFPTKPAHKIDRSTIDKIFELSRETREGLKVKQYEYLGYENAVLDKLGIMGTSFLHEDDDVIETSMTNHIDNVLIRNIPFIPIEAQKQYWKSQEEEDLSNMTSEEKIEYYKQTGNLEGLNELRLMTGESVETSPREFTQDELYPVTEEPSPRESKENQGFWSKGWRYGGINPRQKRK
jgi:hypothetical protein